MGVLEAVLCSWVGSLGSLSKWGCKLCLAVRQGCRLGSGSLVMKGQR